MKFLALLHFGLFSIAQYASAQTLTTSNLPIVVITTPPGQTINDATRTVCDMGVIDNGVGVTNNVTDAYNGYNGKIAIEVRGSTSQQYPKKAMVSRHKMRSATI